MVTQTSEGMAVLGYLAVIARWKWLIIIITIACVAAGFGYLFTRTPLYRASTQLLYVQPVTISNPLVQGGYSQTYQQPDVATVSAMISSSQVTDGAFKLLEGKDTSAGYTVTAVQPVDASGNTTANVVGIEAVSTNAQAAAAAANATAQAFVDWRRDSKRAEVQDALTAVEAALKSYASATARETAEYLQLKQSQQALELQLESLSSDFIITTRATVPTQPFSPRKRHTLTLATILGLALGLGLAFLLEQLDTRVRDEKQMNEMLGMSTLSHLPPLMRRAPDGAPLQMLSSPSGAMAEAVRVLRGNLSFMGVDGDVRSVLVTSSIRTEGKSVTASNLAVSLALAGQRVVLIDGDLRRPRIHTYMHLSNATGLTSVLARRVDLSDAVVPMSLEGSGSGDGDPFAQPWDTEGVQVRIMSRSQAQRGSKPLGQHLSREDAGTSLGSQVLLRVLPSGPLPPNPGEMAASRRLGEMIDALAETADLVIVDAPPILEVGDAAAMASKVDGVIFVVNMGRVRWPILERAHAQLEQFPCRKLGTVIVAEKKVRNSKYGYEYRYSSAPRGAAPPPARS
jgi:Mrp family chromosome partitioning ATPase/capsular polysaccharide biosynthesis protein